LIVSLVETRLAGMSTLRETGAAPTTMPLCSLAKLFVGIAEPSDAAK